MLRREKARRSGWAGSRGILFLLAWQLIAAQKACQSPRAPGRPHIQRRGADPDLDNERRHGLKSRQWSERSNEKEAKVRMLRRASLSALVAIAALVFGQARAALPENLARKAKAWASSEYSDRYLARFAIDGKIPQAGSKGADLGAAWCVRKEKSGDKGVFSLEWDRPVKAATLVYWGRTSWFMNECWKDYEVYLDDEAKPVAKGRFRMVHGPQAVRLPGRPVRKITIRFLNSYGGYNPGALEIQVFPRALSRSEVRALARRFGSAGLAAGVGEVDPEALETLVRRLADLHGPHYPQSKEHLRRLAERGAPLRR